MHDSNFTTEISNHIWNSKYRYRDQNTVFDTTIEDTWHRIANALASVEPKDNDKWAGRFYKALEGFRFIPGGRILAGAGTSRHVTLFNCFVMGIIDDSMEGIFDALKEGAFTMQQGGGVGYDFSTLRPKGSPATSVGSIASGPVSFMRIWDSMCSTLLSTGARRGAMMATLRCDHPDIETFIAAKQVKEDLRHFNLSVLVTDEFMEAVRQDQDWPLVFPLANAATEGARDSEILRKPWPGATTPVTCRVYKRIRARELWNRIMRATYDYAEPGVLFIDRINRLNNLWYRETISSTNPCGEIPLPPYGACNLGSINLTCFVKKPFTDNATLDMEGIRDNVRLAVRMLDNVIDLSKFPLLKQAQQAQGSRRIGLGITGLADTLIMLGIIYGSDESYRLASSVMASICHIAYETSIELGKEKGSFPYFDREKFLQSEFISHLPDKIIMHTREHGIRNSHLTAIAPTGTISLLANNISSGLEPVFDFNYSRRVLGLDGTYTQYELSDYALRTWREQFPENPDLPDEFIDSRRISPQAHIDMQAAIQPFIDNAISKTVNVPEDYSFEAFKDLYSYAYEKGLKGCTTFRPNAVTGAVLASSQKFERAAHCCTVEREAD
jgi:ribonucleoside-diphosphate reductase alpha chain